LRIQDILSVNSIIVDFRPADKSDAITQLGRFLCSVHGIADGEAVVRSALERESVTSTGIGFGVAIPHAQNASIEREFMVAARCSEGIEYDAIDGEPATLFFMLVYPVSRYAEHLDLLKRLSMILQYEESRDMLFEAPDARAFMDCLTESENRYVGS